MTHRLYPQLPVRARTLPTVAPASIEEETVCSTVAAQLQPPQPAIDAHDETLMAVKQLKKQFGCDHFYFMHVDTIEKNTRAKPLALGVGDNARFS